MNDQRDASRSFSKGVLAEIEGLPLITACVWGRRRRKYQRANTEVIISTSIVANSRIVFIYLPLIYFHPCILLNKEELGLLYTQNVGRETCQRIQLVFVNIKDGQKVCE
jgi:hypothetical protein